METSPSTLHLTTTGYMAIIKSKKDGFPGCKQGSRPTCQVCSLKLPLLASVGGRLFLYLVTQRNSRNHERK